MDFDFRTCLYPVQIIAAEVLKHIGIMITKICEREKYGVVKSDIVFPELYCVFIISCNFSSHNSSSCCKCFAGFCCCIFHLLLTLSIFLLVDWVEIVCKCCRHLRSPIVLFWNISWWFQSCSAWIKKKASRIEFGWPRFCSAFVPSRLLVCMNASLLWLEVKAQTHSHPLEHNCTTDRCRNSVKVWLLMFHEALFPSYGRSFSGHCKSLGFLMFVLMLRFMDNPDFGVYMKYHSCKIH